MRDVLNDETHGNGEISLGEITSLTPIVRAARCWGTRWEGGGGRRQGRRTREEKQESVQVLRKQV